MSEFRAAMRRLDVATITGSFRPRFHHPNKEILYELAYSLDPNASGEVTYSRWLQRDLPHELQSNSRLQEIIGERGYFDYEKCLENTLMDWHLNFANGDVFSAWATSLFAQDEMQVAEHPVLAAIRAASTREGFSMYCVHDDKPMPILFAGVERRLRIDTTPKKGLPSGLYGNALRRATPEQVQTATTVISPPTKSNILAIEAPACGEGFYVASQIHDILVTAYSGYAAAKDFSCEKPGIENIRMNTGFWGCGAYGGNRVLMTILQIYAADMAGVKELRFFVGDEIGKTAFDEGLHTYQSLRDGASKSPEKFIQIVEEMKFSWGESDGN